METATSLPGTINQGHARKNTDDENPLTFENVFKLPPVAKHLARYLNEESYRPLMYTSKLMYDTFSAYATHKLFFIVDAQVESEENILENLENTTTWLTNLCIKTYVGDFGPFRPIFEKFGKKMKQLRLFSDNKELNISSLFPLLHLVPDLSRIELEMVGMHGWGWLASRKISGTPLLEHVTEISLKHVRNSFLLRPEWESGTYRALLDLMAVCPNIKMIFVHKDSLESLIGYEFLVRYLYLRCGFVIKYDKSTTDDKFLKVAVSRRHDFAIQLDDPVYLTKFMNRRDRKFQKIIRQSIVTYRGDKIEWTKAGVFAPPDFTPALTVSEKADLVNDGFVFASLHKETLLFESDNEDDTSDEDMNDLDYDTSDYESETENYSTSGLLRKSKSLNDIRIHEAVYNENEGTDKNCATQ